VNEGVFQAQDSIFAGGGTNVVVSGVLISGGYNLVQNTNGCTIAGDPMGNIYGADPRLGPLQDNGGPTWTHALLAGSPAIDAGPANTPPSVDQRGEPRPSGPAEDIGAFEYQYGMPLVQRVEHLMAQVESSWRRPRPLVATLSAALHSIERDNEVAAVNQLRAFQNKVRAQVARSDASLATNFIQAAQELIDALRGDKTHPDGRSRGRLATAVRHPNRRVRMQWSAVPDRRYVLETSTDLVHWERIGVAVCPGDGRFTFEDANAARFPNRFYRIVPP